MAKKLLGRIRSGKKKNSSNDTALGLAVVAFLGIVMAVGLLSERFSGKK